MTKNEQTELAVAMNDIQTIKDDIREIKDILRNQEKRFITRLEGKAAAWIISVAFAALAIWATLQGGK